MTTLTLAKLAEIEAAAAKATPGPWRNTGVSDGFGAHFAVESTAGIVAVVHGDTAPETCNTRDMIALCDPATVAALCRIANIAVRWAHEPHELRNRSPATDDLLDALRSVGLIE